MTDDYNLYLKEFMEVETVFNSFFLVYDEEKATKNVMNDTERLRNSIVSLSNCNYTVE